MSRFKTADGMIRLSERELIEAVQLYLREREDVPSKAVGFFRWRFGVVGEPMMTLLGDAVDLPDAGRVYLDWSFEETPNVALLPRKR